MAALRLSAALLGWRVAMLPAWSHRAIAAIAGIDRDEDYVDAEREEPACLLLVSADRARCGCPAKPTLHSMRCAEAAGPGAPVS